MNQPSLVEDDLGGRRRREDGGIVRQVAVAAAQVDGVADHAPAARDVGGARVLEVGVRGVRDAVPGAVAPEIFSPLLVVVTLAKNSICCEYGAKFMLGEEMLIEPVATKVTLDVTVVLRPLEKLMLPFT